MGIGQPLGHGFSRDDAGTVRGWCKHELHEETARNQTLTASGRTASSMVDVARKVGTWHFLDYSGARGSTSSKPIANFAPAIRPAPGGAARRCAIHSHPTNATIVMVIFLQRLDSAWRQYLSNARGGARKMAGKGHGGKDR